MPGEPILFVHDFRESGADAPVLALGNVELITVILLGVVSSA